MGKANQPDKARKAAVAALVKMHQGGWSNLSLKNVFAKQSLPPRDRAFAGALFYGTAERIVTLDWLLKPLLSRPVQKLDVEIRAILETGLYQMLYMEVPARAAVDESVKLARSFGKSSAAGFVNAVLRKGARLDPPEGPFASEEERVCVTWSLSPPVARAVMRALPEEYDAYLEACFQPGRLCLRPNLFKTTQEELTQELEKQGREPAPGVLPGSVYAQIPGGVEQDPLYQRGWYHVQGEASQYAAACLAPQKGDKVLDLCAAPGGKSATLAMLMGPQEGKAPGVGLCACDVHPGRVELIRKTMARLSLDGVCVRQNDARVFREELQGFDRVLCDVPCSGLGVLGKKPDLRYGDGKNFSHLPVLQGEILENGAASLAPGGRLVYSTCTILPAENQGVVECFLEKHPEFHLVEPPFCPPGAQIRNKTMTMLPHTAGLDGFFVATLERL